MPADSTIVRAAIHPAIGVARVGNSLKPDGFFIGPEVPDEPALPQSQYKDSDGALKRQVAQFRLYGLNAAGEVVAELTTANAQIEWNVHLANKKAAWYKFQFALDIPEASSPGAALTRRRNAAIVGDDRKQLVINPGPRSIGGANQQGAASHKFDTGKFFHLTVPLGELRTDSAGRLQVFGGLGLSQSRLGTAPTHFANNDNWHDDVSDGPVDAKVTINGAAIPVTGAWVIVGPPNYAPALKTPRTFFDLLQDSMVKFGLIALPPQVSFQKHIRPIFERLSGLQWVNQGFATQFGAGAPFAVETLLPQLADASAGNLAFRQQIFQKFRNPAGGQLGNLKWPEFYGDAIDFFAAAGPRVLASLSDLQLDRLKKWADGNFVSDAAPTPITSLAHVPLADQPATLDAAALDYCLADAFHPGCELSWTMRIRHLYSEAFRIKRRAAGAAEDFGPTLTPAVATSATGPLDGAAAGDLTKWMAIPWQTDTASCLAGYDFFNTTLNQLPSFWPARVPNQVLSQENYDTLMNTTKPVPVRRAAFITRSEWFRIFPGEDDIVRMIREFAKLGIVEERAGPTDLPGIPSRVWVESEPDFSAPGPTLTAATAAREPRSKFGRNLRHFGQFDE